MEGQIIDDANTYILTIACLKKLFYFIIFKLVLLLYNLF